MAVPVHGTDHTALRTGSRARHLDLQRQLCPPPAVNRTVTPSACAARRRCFQNHSRFPHSSSQLRLWTNLSKALVLSMS